MVSSTAEHSEEEEFIFVVSELYIFLQRSKDIYITNYVDDLIASLWDKGENVHWIIETVRARFELKKNSTRGRKNPGEEKSIAHIAQI